VRLKLRIAICGLAGLWWVALPATAQIQMDGLNMALNGNLGLGYTGSMSNLGESGHGDNINGNGYFRGYYYNPNFISFAAQPNYGRAQDNAESQSIFDGGGVTASANIFSGSRFPGTLNFSDNKNSTGIFGIPGVAGLVTNNSSHGVSVGWSALLPGWPTLTVGFSDGSGSSSVVGADDQSHSTNRVYTFRSTYRVAGFDFGGGIIHQNLDINTNGTSLTGVEESTTNDTTTYSISAAHKLPLHGYFSSFASRENYTDSFSGGHNSGTTDNVNATVGIYLKVPITVSASYTDDLFGSAQQFLTDQGQPFLETTISPKSSQFDVNATSQYNFHHFGVYGYINHVRQSFGGSSYDLTQFGGTVNYDFGKFIHGLIVTAGVTNTANRDGNQRAALVGSATYIRSLRRWDFSGSFSYDQSTSTLGAIYTTSTLGYSGGFKYRMAQHMHWSGGFTGGHTGFVELAGSGMHSESFTSAFNWRRFTASGNYSKSSGTSAFTAIGLLPVPVPQPIIPVGGLTTYDATGRGGGFGFSPVRRLTINGNYSRVNSNIFNVTGNSVNLTDQMGSRLDYQFRKVYFYAGYIRLRQIVSAAGTPPTSLTSYYFGLSRWFNFF
jgi:hypothetical protein